MDEWGCILYNIFYSSCTVIILIEIFYCTHLSVYPFAILSSVQFDFINVDVNYMLVICVLLDDIIFRLTIGSQIAHCRHLLPYTPNYGKVKDSFF